MSKAKYLVAGRTVYEIMQEDATGVLLRIKTGSDKVRDKDVLMPRSQIEASIRMGEMRAVSNTPKWLGDLLKVQEGSKLDQEAALATQGTAEGTKQRTVRKGRVRD